MALDDFVKHRLDDAEEHDSGPAAESHSVNTASARPPASHLPFTMLNIFPLDSSVGHRHAEAVTF